MFITCRQLVYAAALLLDPASSHKRYTSCATCAPSSSKAAIVDPCHSSDLYNKGPAAAAAMQKKSVSCNVPVRSKTVAKLSFWLHTNRVADSRTSQDVMPENLLVVFTQHCLPNRAGLATGSGGN